ncbi:MAG: tripartite tricarboxylate transporter substrate binding protein [Betaproteobacteria bacterium]|nr:tripartite tricarboxylate transporter substrate binding protein [Betaproteobacteria bacterium]
MIRKPNTGMLSLVVAFCALTAWTPAGAAQNYPARPVRLVVPTAPGGGVDTLARIIGQALTATWSQQIVVDTRGGASGLIGAEIVAQAPGDGHTLLITPTTFSTNVSLFRKLPYDPRKDFLPVSLVSKEPNILVVHPSLPVASLKELIALAKRRPADLNFGFGGVGSAASLSGELFKLRTGVKMVGVSYKGNGPAVRALLAGEVQLMFVGLPPIRSALENGELKALAVTSDKRSSFLPDVPTMAEAGVSGFVVTNWIGLMAPGGTPAGIVQKINSEVAKILASPAMKDRFRFYGVTPDSSTPGEFRKFLDSEIDRWAEVIKAAGLPVN